MPRDLDLGTLRKEIETTDLQLAEVLPAEEYGWAHLPGAVHVPLKEFDGAAERLDRDRPVVTYCHDAQCDMSPRAAAALERIGFADVGDYGGGKMDWLAHGLPYEGDADLVGRHLTKAVSCRPDVPARRVADELRAAGAELAAIVLDSGVVAGAVTADALDGHDGPVADVATVGVTTVRPSEEGEALAHRMGHAGITAVLVTTSSGHLLGCFVAATG